MFSRVQLFCNRLLNVAFQQTIACGFVYFLYDRSTDRRYTKRKNVSTGGRGHILFRLSEVCGPSLCPRACFYSEREKSSETFSIAVKENFPFVCVLVCVSDSQAMRTWALRLFVVPAELQATHWHQKSSRPNSSSTCCRVISILASLTTRPERQIEKLLQKNKTL